MNESIPVLVRTMEIITFWNIIMQIKSKIEWHKHDTNIFLVQYNMHLKR